MPIFSISHSMMSPGLRYHALGSPENAATPETVPVDAQLHGEIVWIWNLVGGDDPRAKRTEGSDGFAETEDAGFHFAALNVAGGDVVKDDVTADVAGGLPWREVLAAFFEHHRELQFVVEFLGEVFGVDHRLFVAA